MPNQIPEEKMFRHPPIKAFLVGVRLPHWLEKQCEGLANSGSFFIRASSVGLLVSRFLETDPPQHMDLVRERVATWIKLMPEEIRDELENEAYEEAFRQDAALSELEVEQASAHDLMQAAYARELLEAVATLLHWCDRKSIYEILVSIDEDMMARLKIRRNPGIGWRSDFLESARNRNSAQWWALIAEEN